MLGQLDVRRGFAAVPTRFDSQHPSGGPTPFDHTTAFPDPLVTKTLEFRPSHPPRPFAGNISYYIEALHNGSNLIREPASGEHSYKVDGTFSTFWSDNFDGAPTGWTSVQMRRR